MLYVSDMRLSDEELTGLEPLTWLAFTHMILWHDYMSWDKEAATYLEREEGGSSMSAVQVYMSMYGLTQAAAKNYLLGELERIEDEYCAIKEKYIAANQPSKHILRYIGLIEMVMAGNTLWHLSSRRYNQSARLPTREDQGKVNGQLLELEAVLNIDEDQDFSGNSDIQTDIDDVLSESRLPLTPNSSQGTNRREAKRKVCRFCRNRS